MIPDTANVLYQDGTKQTSAVLEPTVHRRGVRASRMSDCPHRKCLRASTTPQADRCSQNPRFQHRVWMSGDSFLLLEVRDCTAPSDNAI